MADGSAIESGLLMEVTTAPSTLSQTAPVQIVSGTGGDESVPGEGQVAEDILQQAFVEAEDFAENAVVYDSGEKVEDTSVAAEIVNNVIAEGSLVTTVTDAVTETPIYVGEEYGVVGTEAEVGSADPGLDGETNDMVESNGSSATVTVLEQTVPEPNSQTVVASTQPAQTGSVSVAVIPAHTNLGTSINPIRIIQQGNQYTPVQQLTAEQLQQIMQVVQQQQVAKTSSSASGSSVLFNPQTNTRIVYRVIYPSELHKNSTTGSQTSQGQPNNSLTPHQKRPYKKRAREDEEDKLQEGPELSKEEKDERKKHRPRTRSGRVSKPPKHMMKDYKHIHVLDWDEDYDDSDGGYSDYKCSDEDKQRCEEGGEVDKEVEGTYVYPGLGSTRPKNYKCNTCDKAYIGQAGLSRHFRLYPTHGSIPEGELENDKSQDGSGRTNGNMGSLSEDSNTQDSFPGMETSGAGTPSPVAKRGYVHSGRGRGRGRHMQELSHSRRKAKLKEIVRQCEDEDLMEVVLPRLAKVITLWEFLLMKVEKGYPSRPHADDIYHEFENLHKQVQKACQTYLTPFGKDGITTNSTRSLQVENAQLAQALGLEVGTFEVKEMPIDGTSTFQSKQTPEKIYSSYKPLPVRRKIQETTPDQLPGHTVAKRPKTVSILPDTSPVKSSASSGSVHKGTSSVQFRVVSAASSSSAASLETPHIIAVSNPHIVGVVNNNATVPTPHIVTVSNPNIVSNTKIISVSNPNMTTASTPHVVAVSNSNQQIVTVPNPSVSGSSILATVGQPHAVLRPPESSVQATSQVGGVDKSQEILTSQAATSTMLTNSTEASVVLEPDSASPATTAAQNVVSVINSANAVPISTTNVINSASNSAIIESAPSDEPLTLRTVLVNGNVTNSTDVKHLQPLVQEALQTDIQNIQVVNTLEEAQQLVLAQSQMNGVDPASNITTLAEVVHHETEFTEQSHENVAEIKREIVINPQEVKQDGVVVQQQEGQVVSAEQVDGQVIDPDQIVTHSNIYQTEDGILIIQNPDGTTFQLQGAEGIPLETVQALLAMEGQFEGGEQVQAELQ